MSSEPFPCSRTGTPTLHGELPQIVGGDVPRPEQRGLALGALSSCGLVVKLMLQGSESGNRCTAAVPISRIDLYVHLQSRSQTCLTQVCMLLRSGKDQKLHMIRHMQEQLQLCSFWGTKHSATSCALELQCLETSSTGETSRTQPKGYLPFQQLSAPAAPLSSSGDHWRSSSSSFAGRVAMSSIAGFFTCKA